MFVPENKLERSLMDAAKDPSSRPQFYRDLLEGELFIVSELKDKSLAVQAEFILPKDSEINIQSMHFNGRDFPVCFTSLVCFQKSINKESGYIKMKAKDFLEIIKESGFLLNPGLEYGKEFTAEEVKRILDGSIWVPKEGYTIERESKIFLGQPAKYPIEMVEAIKKLFKQIEAIHKGYLVQIYIPSRNEPPHPVIGIEIDENADWNNIVSQIGMVLEYFKQDVTLVDTIKIKNGDQISDYMIKETKPFYKR